MITGRDSHELHEFYTKGFCFLQVAQLFTYNHLRPSDTSASGGQNSGYSYFSADDISVRLGAVSPG